MSGCPTCGALNRSEANFCSSCGGRLAGAGREPSETPAEHRIVTLLFCDVRGSTAMAEEMDPEEWTDVMNAAFEHLIAPVHRYEGTVARLMGDAILAFFGAPTAHEDDPQRAVAAGLEIVSSIAAFRERLARERGVDLDVRVGINTGPVVVGEVGSELAHEYTAMGDAVNVAARMEQAAEPGTVQITEDTYRLVADLFEVEPLGPVELKGKSHPVPSYRVLDRRPEPWRVRAARRLEAPLVGRTGEMATLRAALEDARSGRGSVVLITGESGIGKTRLLEETSAAWAALQPDDDRRWGLWPCVPYDTMQPYAQFRRQIRERGGIAETDPPQTVRAKLAEVLRFVPEASRRRAERAAQALLRVEPEDRPHLEGEAFQRELTALLIDATLAGSGPRLVAFEDLHWCDHASLELIRTLVARVTHEPLVCLITFRPDRDAVSWDFRRWVLEELAGHSRVIEMLPLSPELSEDLIDELLPVDGLPDQLRRRILDTTEGNPLFVQEVARTLMDRGAIERSADGDWRLSAGANDIAIPGTVQSLITVGLDHLPDEARRALQTAAVIGRTFDRDVLATVLGTGERTDDDLRELERRDLIRAVGGSRPAFTFRHALTQEAAYGSLLLKRRRVVHRRVGEALAAANADRLDEVAPLLVRHFGMAGDDPATLRYARLAGDAAARLYANVEAETHYSAALQVARRTGAEPPVLRALYEGRGIALELSGRYDEAMANYEEMRDAARAADDEAFELAANTAISVLYSTATPKYDPELGRRLSEENVVVARRLGERAAEARALWNIVVANIYGGGDEARAVEAGEASLAIARGLGDREQVAYTLQDVSRAYIGIGEHAAAAERLREARELWQELDSRPMLAENFGIASSLIAFDGDLPTALSSARTAVSIAEGIENVWGQAFALICRYRIELALGDVGAALGSMQRCLELEEGGGFSFGEIASRGDLARVYVELGDPHRALPMADRSLERARRELPPALPLGHLARGEALIEIGDLSAAGTALREVDVRLMPGPDRPFLTVALALARSRLALRSARPSEAASAAEDALGFLRSRGVRLMVAEALAALARAHLADGRLREAEDELAEAAESAERHGERRALWEILALTARVHAGRGAGDEAAACRRRARGIAERIAAGVPDRDLRGRFLGRVSHALSPKA